MDPGLSVWWIVGRSSASPSKDDTPDPIYTATQLTQFSYYSSLSLFATFL